MDEEHIAGLSPTGEFSFKLDWPASDNSLLDELKLFDNKSVDQTDFNNVAFTLTRIIKRVGHLYIEFEGVMLGREEVFKLFSTTDRRQARRVSRKIGRRFNWRGGVARWRS